MSFRCEEFVKNYLPSVKAKIVEELYEEYDLTQVEISDIFDITQPSVSQYLNGERGGEEIPQDVLETTKLAAEKIYHLYERGEADKNNISEVLCDICREI